MSLVTNIHDRFFARKSDSLFDTSLLYCVLLLVGLGFVMVNSASMPVSERIYNNPYHITTRHCMFLGMSFILFWYIFV